MEKEALTALFKKYHDGECTEEEKALLEAWYLAYNEKELDITPARVKAIGNRIFRELPGNYHSFARIGIQLAIAAAVMGAILTIAIYFSAPFEPKKTAQRAIIHPGSNVAILTLANGQQIDLASANAGQLAIDANSKIYKSADGRIAYHAGEEVNEPIANNQLITPKGGQWQVTLPDGSQVWLNSASTLSYPTSFRNQKDRVVHLTGEAYFEVAKDKSHPFKVKSGGQTVEVLGTHFNINSYPDETAQKTTLAEGRVKVTDSAGGSALLVPGQQALHQPGSLKVVDVTLADELAWKDGSFHLADQDIQSIMRQLARWYNIEVQYQGDIKYEGLNGRISRLKNLDQILKALEATQTVHFKVEGRRITVMK